MADGSDRGWFKPVAVILITLAALAVLGGTILVVGAFLFIR